MNALLKLTRFPYEEPYQIQLLVEASNGRQRATIDYYTHASDLPELGEALLTFPLTESKQHIYEIGSKDPKDRFAYYLKFRFFLIRATGDSGIELHFCNNRDEAPYREMSEFTIPCEVAGINRLGKLIKDFGKLEHRALEWNGTEGQLSKT
jgi:hypothetical protein